MPSIMKSSALIKKNGIVCIIGTSGKYPGKYIRVIVLDDYMTIHNAFFDRGFRNKIGDKN